jgi:coenzyme F420-0:L-glutamate ligase/coenzyme F420-1:gamma-L-glutamate ligase
MELTLSTIDQIPLIKTGDDLGELIAEATRNQKISPQNGDIFVLAQKIVSKAEGRMVNMTAVIPRSPVKIRASSNWYYVKAMK